MRLYRLNILCTMVYATRRAVSSCDRVLSVKTFNLSTLQPLPASVTSAAKCYLFEDTRKKSITIYTPAVQNVSETSSPDLL